MRSGKAAATLLLIGGAAVGAQLEPWVQHIPIGPLFSIFFQSLPMPGGNVIIRRVPAETRVALSRQIDLKPRVASLYRLRAHEDELALDFPTAENDWRKLAQLSTNRAAGYTELADYFDRREQPAKEIEALGVVENCKTNPITPLDRQLPWKAVERTQTVASEEALPDSVPAGSYATWVGLHPTDMAGFQKAIDFYVNHRLYDEAQTAIDAYARQFPDDRIYPITRRADLAAARGSVDQAIDLYDSSFAPLWPAELSAAYFSLLEKESRLRDFLGKARQNLQNKPIDLDATSRLFHYFQNQKNGNEAKRALLNFRLAKESTHEPYTDQELWTLGQLFERLPDWNEAARSYYALYSVPGATNQSAEWALGALANLLLLQSDQPIAFGSGDLSFYRDIGEVDRSPGFLNGIFSLVFNSTSPARTYGEQNPKSAVYFRRSAGERLVSLLQQRFPKSDRLPALKSAIVHHTAMTIAWSGKADSS